MKSIKRNILNLMPDKLYLKLLYYRMLKKNLNLKQPKTFNEKLQWLKLYDRRPIYTKMVDKFAVREYIKQWIGEEYLIPLVGVWDSVEEIDFDSLPNQFVLKTTHDSGGVRICKDKKTFDFDEAKSFLNSRLKLNYYYIGREWPYKNVKPRIIAEEYINNSKGDLPDYKFMCFNSKVKYIFTCSDRNNEEGLKVTFFDLDWNVLPFERHYPRSTKEIQKPNNFDKMIKFAEILSENISFLRVDFYEVDNQLFFGELTFYPGSGFEEFEPEIWDRKLGDLLNLPDKKN